MGRKPMKPASASRSLAAAAALCTAVLLGACKTTEEKWSQRQIGTEWEKRTMSKATRAMEQINAAAAGDDSEGYMANEFDQGKSLETTTSLFGKKYAKEKTFRTQTFAGTKDFKSTDYQFLRRQEFDAKSSPDQDLRFADGNTESPDAKRKSIWQRMRADTKDYADAEKVAGGRGYRDTERESARLERTDPNIVEDAAREDGATLSVDDVRHMLHGSD